ncbi:MAG: RagB/SusD family nutrient uptake outer membrane protein, partial [Gemmatimonadaceae bacterium]
MKLATVLGAAAALLTVSGCDRVLNTEPYDRVSSSSEIVDASTAQAALNGAYAALQSSGMYGQYLLSASALTSHEAEWGGTFQFLGDMASNVINADNNAVSGMWNAHYLQIDRDNTILQRVPAATGIDAATSNEIMGEAYFLRAL